MSGQSDDPVDRAFDPERFRALGHRVVERLADQLAAARSREVPVTPAGGPEEMLERWRNAAPATDLEELLDRVASSSTRQHHPGYMGFQVAAPVPTTALVELASALLNNGMASYASGPASSALERLVVERLAAAVGWSDDAAGILTSGGTLGNLTALLAARQLRAGGDPWEDGTPGGGLAVLAAETAHYCIDRAVRIMGWGAGGVVRVACDHRHRLDPKALPAAAERARRGGRAPVAVVATAGSTVTGGFDDLRRIADFCSGEGLWLHVDGAHGLPAVFSARHRGLLAGIERADSLVWDAHKVMLLPGLVTAVLFRDGRASYRTFAQRASYLYDEDAAGERWADVGLRTLECTKRMMSVQLHAALELLGPAFFGAVVDRTWALGRGLAARIEADPELELAVEPEANIVCFRHRPSGGRGAVDLDAHQLRLRDGVNRRGRVFVASTDLGGAHWLRTTLMNPLTTDEDLERLCGELRTVAAELDAEAEARGTGAGRRARGGSASG